jgi:cellulose synthase/poly-beta-1,6-N-acetylglucosamine synthase-like glycosyltransferase
MTGTHVQPVKATTWLEKVIEVGVKAHLWIGQRWQKADNYLLANGRCLAFRTKAVKQFNISTQVINSDAYLYFENKCRGGKFRWVEKAIVLNKSPQKLAEYLKQSHRFLNSSRENSDYFNHQISSEYKIPFSLKLKALAHLIVKSPVWTGFYLGLYVLSRLSSWNQSVPKTGVWETDASTKRG